MLSHEISSNPRRAFTRPQGKVVLEAPIGPHPVGTVLLLASLLMAWARMGGRTGSEAAHGVAIVVGAGLVMSAAADASRGISNLIRADFFAILSFYFLTLFEFFFRQPNYDTLVTASATMKAIPICLWALAGLAIGRHLVFTRTRPFRRLLTTEVPPGHMIGIFLGCVVIGYGYMLVATNFNIVRMINAFMAPRFSQPWARGKFGDWKALFEELGMLLFLIPPLAGVILARRKDYGGIQLGVVSFFLALTLFYGFTSGTRHIFDSYLVTFLIGYAFATRKERRFEMLPIAAVCVVLLIVSTVLMVRFREVGLRNYLRGEVEFNPGRDQEVLAVDLNLFPMSRIAEVIPSQHGYLGFEIIYQALIRPIPRAIWHGKPEGMSVSIEDIVGANGWTVAASFAGEAYMSGGLVAVFLIAAGFGWIAGWWNQLGSDDNSPIGCLIYSSGFFAVVVSMRSILVFTTAMLPTVACFAAGYILIRKVRTPRGAPFRRPAGALSHASRPATPAGPPVPRSAQPAPAVTARERVRPRWFTK